jgi:hypothetical protein
MVPSNRHLYKTSGKEQFVGFTVDNRRRRPRNKAQATKGAKLLTETVVQHSATHINTLRTGDADLRF